MAAPTWAPWGPHPHPYPKGEVRRMLENCSLSRRDSLPLCVHGCLWDGGTGEEIPVPRQGSLSGRRSWAGTPWPGSEVKIWEGLP